MICDQKFRCIDHTIRTAWHIVAYLGTASRLWRWDGVKDSGQEQYAVRAQPHTDSESLLREMVGDKMPVLEMKGRRGCETVKV